MHDAAQERDLIATFLGFYVVPTDYEIDLWAATLAPVQGNIKAAFASWLRCSDEKPKPIDIVQIIQAAQKPDSMWAIALKVSLEHGIALSDLLGRGQDKNLCAARHKAMYQMHVMNFSYTQIGNFMNRDHSTVMHAVQKIKAQG